MPDWRFYIGLLVGAFIVAVYLATELAWDVYDWWRERLGK